jgi:hypothetical protein
MNYSELNPSLDYNRFLPSNAGSALDNDKFQENKNSKANYYCGNKSSLALRSVQMENTKVSELLFSSENIDRLQKKIKSEVLRLSNNKYKLEEDQDEMDLILAMRAVFLDYGKNLNTNIVRQVKKLNEQIINYIMPDLMTNIQQAYGYNKFINEPLKPIARPMNVSHAGRKTLPAMTSVWGF